MTDTSTNGKRLVLIEGEEGRALIPTGPLARLNYFDGKFLRAADLKKEQDYLRLLVQTSNLGGGGGVVHGFDTTLAGGDELTIGPGLAIDGRGRVLLLPTDATVGVQSLLDAEAGAAATVPASRAAVKLMAGGEFELCGIEELGPGVEPTTSGEYFVLCIAHAEAWCGQEDVYGRLCEDACATDTARPYVVEGVVVRALPLQLLVPLATSSAVPLSRIHLRSRLASALFAQEAMQAPASMISRAGLSQQTWCLGAELAGEDCVPLALVVRSGGANVLLDAWSVRRERIEAPARRYWAWRMRMRPWDVFLAQVLQFQCQLADMVLVRAQPGGDDDPCAQHHEALGEAQRLLTDLRGYYVEALQEDPEARAHAYPPGMAGGITRIEELTRKVGGLLQSVGTRSDKVLIDGGIVELPPAGYLPVDPASAVTVNDQVRQLLGKGLDLRFCVVRPDFVAHALEEAQHMDRISLLEGLDHPEARPRVDVLVPDGQVVGAEAPASDAFEATLLVSPTVVARVASMLLRASLEGEGGIETRPFAEVAPEFALQEYNFEFLLRGAARGRSRPGEGATFAAAVARAGPAFPEPTPSPEPTEVPMFVGVEEQPTPRPITPAAVLIEVRPLATAAWLEVHSERDVLGLAPQESTAITIRASAVLFRAAIDGQVRGDLIVRSVRSLGGGQREILALLSGFSWANVVSAQGSASLNRPVDLPLQIVVGPDEHGMPSARIAVVRSFGSKRGTSEGDLIVNWGGAPFTITARLEEPATTPTPSPTVAPSVEGPGTTDDLTGGWWIGAEQPFLGRDFERQLGTSPERTTTLAAAQFVQNADVVLAGNALHVLADTGLQAIGRALRDASFRDRAIEVLFPPPPLPTGEQVVKAARDWVLFHRRRDIDCGPPLVVARATRRYFLYELEPFAGSLVILPPPALRPIGPVEFAAETAELLTRATTLQLEWRSAGAGRSITGAGILDIGGGQDLGLLIQRIGAVEEALAPTVVVDPQSQNHVLTQAPEGADARGTDGVILLEAGEGRPTPTPTPTPVPQGDLLKVKAVTVRRVASEGSTGTNLGQLKPPSTRLVAKVQSEPNAIDIQFEPSDALDPETVRLNETFFFEGPTPEGQLIRLGSDTIRYYLVDGGSFQVGVHKFLLVGTGLVTVMSRDGVPLDGDYESLPNPALPSGDDTAGGDFLIEVEFA